MLDLWLAALLDSSLKGFALCLAAAGAAFVLRRASAATRHLVWRLAFVGLLALPVLAGLVPEWRVGVDLPDFEDARPSTRESSPQPLSQGRGAQGKPGFAFLSLSPWECEDVTISAFAFCI